MNEEWLIQEFKDLKEWQIKSRLLLRLLHFHEGWVLSQQEVSCEA